MEINATGIPSDWERLVLANINREIGSKLINEWNKSQRPRIWVTQTESLVLSDETYLLNQVLSWDGFQDVLLAGFLNVATNNKFIENKVGLFKVKNYIQLTNLWKVSKWVNGLVKANEKHDVRFQSTYQAVRHSDESTPDTVAHCPFVRRHSKSRDLHIWPNSVYTICITNSNISVKGKPNRKHTFCRLSSCPAIRRRSNAWVYGQVSR